MRASHLAHGVRFLVLTACLVVGPDAIAQDTALETLLQTALTQNLDLQALQQRVREAEGLASQAGLRPNPSVEFSVSEGSVLGSNGERSLAVNYRHVFELGGKRDRRMDVAALRVELARLEVAEAERQLSAAVRETFTSVLAAERLLGNLDQHVEASRNAVELASARATVGEGAKLEEALFQTDTHRLTAERPVLTSRRDRLLLELKLLAGLDPEVTVALSGSPSVEPVELSLEEAITTALTQRPDLAAARVEQQIRAAEIRLAEAVAVPDATGFVEYAHGRSRFPQLGLTPAGNPTPLVDTDNMLRAGVSFELPWSNWNQGNIQAAVARENAADLRVRYLEQAVTEEVRAAFRAVEAAAESLEVLEEQLGPLAESNLQVVRQAYELGEFRAFDVVTERRRSIEVEQARIETQRTYALARIELDKAMGASGF
jgi:cobalt-zinc-cadmium efflux system outer membrane protein